MAKMEDTELVNILGQHLSSASSEYYTKVEESRESALEYYYQRPYGNECEGRSSVVTSEVADSVNWMMPSLMRTFTSSDVIAQFDPKGPDDEEAARQETDYVNYIFWKKNDGFNLLYNWFQDALLMKNGVVKVGYRDDIRITHENYTGLTEEEFMQLANDTELTVDNYDVDGNGLIEAEFTRRKDMGEAFVECIPPEEFYINPDYENLSLEEAPFACHETLKTRTELIDSGFDKAMIEGLNSSYDHEAETVKDARGSDLGGWTTDYSESSDETMDLILVSDCYILVDYDGDGQAEYRRVVLFNRHTIGLNEECTETPFVSITPNPMAHRFYGRSIADQTMDIQLQKSTLLRNILDNLYLTNNQEKIVLEGGANLDDLLVSTPGGIKREYVANAIRPMPVTPFNGHPYQMLEYFDSMKENRTGVTKYNQGMDAESLNQTATGVNKIMTASQSRMELIARLFADGIAKMLVKLHSVLLRNQDKKTVVKLRGNYVEINPAEWKDRTAMTINVGLGTGDTTQQLQSLQLILGMQMQALPVGMSTPAMVYNTYTKIVEAAGLKTPELYFTPPQQMPQQQQQGGQQPPPDPQAQALMMNAQVQQEQNQIDREKNQMEHQREMQELQIRAREVAIKEYELGIKQQDSDTKAMEAGIRFDQDQQRINEEIRRDTMEMLGAQQERAIDAQRPEPPGSPGSPNSAGGVPVN